MLLSNTKALPLQFTEYQLDPKYAVRTCLQLDNIKLFADMKSSSRSVLVTHERSPASSDLLKKVFGLLKPIVSCDWLVKRGISNFNGIYSLDYECFSRQELLDLNIIPGDHIIEKFGEKPVEGLIFPDFRDGELFGICVRNCSTDLPFVAAAKYTFSNFDHFLYGLDDHETVAICEGVFDKLALDSIGVLSVALGSAYPSFWQLACIENCSKNVEIYM